MRLDISNAAYSYDEEGDNVFENITFSVGEGDIFCVLGPNGTGKSTLIKCIGNLLRLKQGSIKLEGEDILSLDNVDVAKKIGYIPQVHSPTFPFSVLDVVLMGRAPHLSLLSSPAEKDFAMARDAIKVVGIPHLIDKPYTEISGGERQLVLLARILAQQPSILLLDEPTSHLDFGNQIRILNMIDKLAKNGLSIIMASHFPDHAFLTSNKVAIMKGGTFIDMGSPDKVITEENMKSAYGVDVKIVYVNDGANNGRKVCIPLMNR